MKPVLVLYSMSHAHDTTSSNNNDNHDHKDVHNDDNSNRNSNNDIDTMKKRMVEVERIPLHEYASKDALHTLFWNLGFTKKSHEEQQHVLENAQQMQYNERLQYHIRLEYYKWRTIYVNDFRTQVMGMTVEAYQEQTKFQRLTCHPSGPIPDMLNDHYDRINRNIAGAYKEDRYLYAVRYLENLATSTGTTKQ